MKINFKRIILIALVIPITTTLVTGCSPIAPYEDGIETLEKRIKTGDFKKEREKKFNLISSYSGNDKYLNMVETQLKPSVIERTDPLIRSIKSSVLLLREKDHFYYNAEDNEFAKKTYISLKNKWNKINSIYIKEIDSYRFYAELINNEELNKDEVNSSLAKFMTLAINLENKVNKAKTDYPLKVERLDGFVANSKDKINKYKELIAFFDKNKSDRTTKDFDSYYSLYKKLGIKKDKVLDSVVSDIAKIESLYESYSKILLSESDSHTVQISMTTWDGYYDYPTESTVSYPYVKVTREQLDKIVRGVDYNVIGKEDVNNNRLIETATGSGSPANSWSSGDDYASVWVEDSESEYTHEYLIILDGETETVFEDVSKGVYMAFEGKINNEVLSKPYGFFEDEIITMAAPAGSSYVGNTEYGNWKKDPTTGVDVWQWLPAYLVLSSLSDSRYDRQRYSDYNKQKMSYRKVKGRGYDSFGTSTGSGGNFKSSYSKSSSGSHLRGVGSSSRNRGPGSGK